jgi:hypothetical protein
LFQFKIKTSNLCGLVDNCWYSSKSKCKFAGCLWIYTFGNLICKYATSSIHHVVDVLCEDHPCLWKYDCLFYISTKNLWWGVLKGCHQDSSLWCIAMLVIHQNFFPLKVGWRQCANLPIYEDLWWSYAFKAKTSFFVCYLFTGSLWKDCSHLGMWLCSIAVCSSTYSAQCKYQYCWCPHWQASRETTFSIYLTILWPVSDKIIAIVLCGLVEDCQASSLQNCLVVIHSIFFVRLLPIWMEL